ncbi:hypothetical protein QOZ80_6BG0504850 [Eleusine coracana subsp. coracana]|nr:hypothetical protein QOZ80_6BG0504850 [Eleusine coracana subsp. coracana]
MAPSFARSISFPLSPSRSSSFNTNNNNSKHQSRPSSIMASSSSGGGGGHARSVSLPCRSHPILAHLHMHIRAVRGWAQDPTSVSSGLAHVDALHAALGELLDLPEAQAALAGAASSDRLLDSFLRLADAHGSFQEAVVELKQDVADALAAIRRHDAARLASSLRAQRKAGKELARLATAAREGARPSRLGFLGGGGTSSAAEVEVVGLLAESAAATASASAALFNIVAAMSASASAEVCSCKRTAALVCLLNLNKKASSSSSSSSDEQKETTSMALMERLEELQECIQELDTGSDKVFRSLVQTRVALLNVHTHIVFHF